jgi:hypothetical protein
MANGATLRSPAGSATGNDAELLLGVVMDDSEEFPTAKKGRQASEVPPVLANTFQAILDGTVRFAHYPPKDQPADAKSVVSLRNNVKKWLDTQGISATHRGEYSTTAKDKDGNQARVAFRIIRKG